MTFLTGCETTNGFIKAEEDKADARVADEATDKICILAPFPDEFRVKERAGIRRGDDARTALVRYDRALSRANNRIERIGQFYDKKFADCQPSEEPPADEN